MQFRGQRTPPLSELDIWTLWKYGGERKKRKNSGNKEKVGRKKVGGHFPINIQIMIVLAFYDNGYCIYRECFGPLLSKTFFGYCSLYSWAFPTCFWSVSRHVFSERWLYIFFQFFGSSGFIVCKSCISHRPSSGLPVKHFFVLLYYLIFFVTMYFS